MTRMVVPTAGTDPGRAARAPQLQTPQLGAAIADLGDTALQVGTALETDRLHLNRQRNTIDLTADMNDLRLSVEAMGDPDQAEAAWQSGVKDLRGRYLGGPDGTPGAVDPKNAADFELTFEELANRQGFSLGKRTLALRQSERQANFLRYSDTASRVATSADPETRAALVAEGEDIIAQNLAAGVIDAETAELQRQGLRGDVANARAIGLIDEDPQAFITAADAGDFDGLSGDTLARYRNQATGALERQAAAAAREAEKAAETRQREIGEDLVAIREIAAAGREAVDERKLADPAYQQHPEFGRTAAALDLREEQGQLQLKTPGELRALIEAEEGRSLARPWQTERLEVLRETLDDTLDEFAKDPIASAAARGLIDDAPLDFDAGPAGLGRDVLRRVREGYELADAGYTDTPTVFTAEERVELKSRLQATEDPRERAVLAATLAGTLPSDGPDSLVGVTGDPLLGHVGMLASASGSVGLSAEILRGQEALARDNIKLPPIADRAETAFGVIETVFTDIPGGEAYRQAAVAAADALYARRMGRVDPDEGFDEDVYQQAFHEVMGGIGKADSRSARGGVQDVRGMRTILPQGVAADRVDDTLDRLGIMEVATGPRQTATNQFDAETLLAQLGQASNGQRPDILGELPDAATMASMQLQAVGDDTYVFVRPRSGGRPEVLLNDAGAQFTFSLRALLQAVGP